MRVIYFIMIFIPCILLAQTVDYFPAHIGDTFEYETTYDGSYQKTYYKTIITNIITKTDGGIDIYFDNSKQPRYYKAMNGNVFQYDGNKPCLWYNFTTSSLDTFHTKFSNMEIYVSVYYGSSSIFGNNLSARSFTFNDIKTNFYYATHWLGNGIGILNMGSNISSSEQNRLIGSIIDGKRYGTLVSVNEEKINPNFELYQNYPNPFNPSTVIKYSLPEPSHVSLSIYNILGGLIETIVDEYQNFGIHSVNLNASKYSSGVYLYRLQSNKYYSIRKLLIIK
jgi:hypothetical protein